MAFANVRLIEALRTTAAGLRDESTRYAWGHHGYCNCGRLTQTVTAWTPGEILRFAHTGVGEWSEMAQAWCPDAQAPVDFLVGRLVELGLTPSDIHSLEHLDDKAVLRALPGGFRWLRRNNRHDAALYMDTLARMLEEQLAARAVARELASLREEELV